MRDYEFYYTQDGSIGLYSYTYDDVYHSKYGALTEAWEKFILPSGIDKLLNTKENINILDLCYGVGYNTKALMSYVINQDEKFLKQKNFFKNILKNLKKEIKSNNIYNESIDSDKRIDFRKDLSLSIDSENEKTISVINIDCLELNDKLVKLSPFLKTVFTPQEIYEKIVPKIFDCFDTYWIIRKKLSKFTLKIALRNRRKITEFLDLKYKNDYDLLNSNYKIHKYVNFIIINALLNKYKDNYINKELKIKLTDRTNRRFFDRSKIKYAKFKQNFRYNLLYKFNLFAFLHNIYYSYLSIRDKNIKFEDAQSLFKLNFLVNDARKSILTINRQYDIIFLDAFTCSKAPELWSVEFIAELYKRLSPRGVLITYSNSALVRNTLLENNFYLGKILDAKTGKPIGTIAAKEKTVIEHPLSNYEIGLCNTRAGITYHDPGLSLDRETILKRREYEFKTSDLMTSTQYMRSRMNKNEENDAEEW